MEYRPIADLDNLYPLTENPELSPYNTVAKDLVSFTGLYPSINKIDIAIKSIKDLQIVADTNFQFIIAVKKYNIDEPERIQYFTSPSFFSLLETSLYESNHYFVNAAQGKFLYYTLPLSSKRTITIDAKYIVEFVLEETLKLFSTPTNPKKKSIKRLENEVGVNFTKNIYYNYLDNSIDYYSLIKYIDWVVSSESLPEIIEQNGVLDASSLCEFQYGRLDSGGNFVSKAAYDLQTKIQDLQDELDALNIDIGKVEYAIKNPTNAELNLSNVAIGLIGGAVGSAAIGLGAAALFGGYSLAAAGISGALSYAAVGGVLGPIGIAAGLVVGGLIAIFGSNKNKNAQQKAINEFVQNLKGELAKLIARKTEIETQISNLKKNLTIVGSTVPNQSGINKIDLSTTYIVKNTPPPPPMSGTIDAPSTGGNQSGGNAGGQGFNYTGTFGS
jgi:chaperonin cofactor prefoldin